MEAAMKSASVSPERQYYVDWIRVLGMFGIFLFHNARFYDIFSDWHVKNAATNVAASGFVAFMSVWMMPLFFLVAGASTFLALRSRSPGQYALERTLRLLIPFIFGMLIIVVPQAYFQALFQGENLSGYNIFQIYWLYLQTLPDVNTFHLWFLQDLYLFSLITIPLFLKFGSSGKSIITRLADYLNNPWVLMMLLVILIAVVNIFLYPDGFWGNRNGGWNIITYVLFFILGYLIFANPRIMESIKKYRWIFLAIGIVVGALVFGFFIDELADPVKYFGSASFVIASILHTISAWGWLLAILGLGYQLLNRTNRFLSYANEAVLPFYILHQTVIISIGYYVVQWNIGVGPKYLFITITSFIGIMLIYEFLVRRINILRFLFGMRLKRKSISASAPGSQK
jgi:glucans biosynthesis protein C